MSSQNQLKTKHRLTSDGVWRSAWLCGRHLILILAILIGILAGWVFGSILGALIAGLWVALTLQFTTYISRLIYSRRFAGCIIKDYGKPSRWLLQVSFLAISPLFLYLLPEFMMGPFIYLSSPVSFFFAVLFWCPLILLGLFQNLSHLQLRDNGISIYGQFVDWDWVESYSWGWEDHMLYLKGKNQILRYALLFESYWIASSHKNVVDELLEKHIRPETPMR